MDNDEFVSEERPFSLKLYLFIIFILSWPFLMVTAWAAIVNNGTIAIVFSSTGMLMVTVGTFISGRYVFKDGFKDAGWNWGKPIHYILSFATAFLLFGVPMLINVFQGSVTLLSNFTWIQYILLIGGYTLLILAPAFGEEFGFRGYLLPHLSRRYTPRKAVIINSLIWWFWHQPVAVGGALVTMKLFGADSFLCLLLLSGPF